MDKKQLLQRYRNMDFKQIREIEKAIENGLSEKEINIFAKTNLSDYEMKQIRLLLEYNLTAEHKVTEGQINYMINLWSSEEMELVRICYEKNMLQNEVEDLIKEYRKTYKIEEIIEGLENGLTINEIKKYINPEYNERQRKQLRLLLEYNLTADPKLTEEQINFVTNPNLEYYEMQLIKLCYQKFISQNEIERLLNTRFDSLQIKEICNGLENGLSLEEIRTYAKPELDYFRMYKIRLALEYNSIESKQISEIIDNIEQKKSHNFEINDTQDLDKIIANNPPEKSSKIKNNLNKVINDSLNR